MMKKILLALMIVGLVSSCNDWEELNTDKKSATEVPASTLFTNGLREMSDMLVNTNVNENVFRLYAQYWAQTTYPDESAYNQVTRNNGERLFLNGYRNALMDLTEAEKVIMAGLAEGVTINSQIAIIKLVKAYGFAFLVDVFGDVPYTEALNIEATTMPKYDDAASIYDALLADIDLALANLSGEGFAASQDPIYGGDVAAWEKFGQTLKLRLGMMLADVSPAKSKSIVEATYAKAFASNADNAAMTYNASAPNTNPLWEDLVQSGRKDFLPSNTLVDKLNELADPRMSVYVVDTAAGGVYAGGIYGTANSYNAFSHIGRAFFDPELEGVILDYSEVCFWLAEAAERGYSVGGTAADWYEKGITANFDYWGVAGAAAYIADPKVAYATATGTWKQKIGVQSWLALYNRGFEGWTCWRRLDFDGFNPPPGMTVADIPTRFIYPIPEGSLNEVNKNAAADAIGGDLKTTKLFWDKN